MVAQRRASVADAGPTLSQHWAIFTVVYDQHLVWMTMQMRWSESEAFIVTRRSHT